MTVDDISQILQYLQYIQDLLTMILTFVIGFFIFKSLGCLYRFINWMFK